MKRLFTFWLFAFFASPLFFSTQAIAADANGYTAKYECRAGNPNCNVDVVAYTTAACAQTITAADSLSTIESKLNSGSSPICITPGDYTSKGTIVITSSGSSSDYRVLRYTRSGDNNDDPWKQSSSNQAKLKRLVVGGSYWIIHRVAFPPVSGGLDKPVRLEVGYTNGGISNVIINRIQLLGSGPPSGYSYYGFSQWNCGQSYSDITFQNSVAGGYYGNLTSEDSILMDFQCVTRGRLVNNELYDWAGGIIQYGSNTGGGGPKSGSVIENNDCYYSDLALTQGGARIKGEGCISFKQSGSAAGPVQIINNRIWNHRYWDSAFCCNGSSGSAVGLGAGGTINSDYINFQNNIVFDSQQGIEWTHWNEPSSANYNSVIGNIFYSIKKYLPSGPAAALWSGYYGVNSTEVYLNTFIDTDTYASGPFKSNNDFQCNVNISAGSNASSAGTGTEWDYNVYYDSSSNGESVRRDDAVVTRSNSTFYPLNTIIRTASPENCRSASDSACFLYRVTTPGTSAGSNPGYTTALGGTTTDGSMVITAIRGPYSFKRKLHTVAGGETYVIPYAKAHITAQEQICPSTIGSRSNIGINNAPIF